ncbi:hypothetical protein QR680_011084 [Steinernema hermaphroditum]|uniref:7TM GPCR serpentine receptor class x (Srx) domain-containing protein n=1 Tax=Steinernema hermaphroditum TaxID=289476 RepID=A0AA39MBQ3_9BILA|nr:hypothetical protein QR680_011084 [Steinernema hermaphroditum]
MNSSKFVFGFEFQGRGEVTERDIIVGSIMLALSLTAVILGSTNLVIIYRSTIFHSAFGWFWATRTSSEIVSNAVHVVYSAPVTLLQPQGIPPIIPVLTYLIMNSSAFLACMIHQAVSTNRFIAVFLPHRYKFIFTKRRCVMIVLSLSIPVVAFDIAYIAVPCNLVGYGPTKYENVFATCEPHFHRNYSPIVASLYQFCFVVCAATIFTDSATLLKILHMRFSSVQNISMILTSLSVLLAGSTYRGDDDAWRISGLSMIIVTHICNALALIFFNPEVRKQFFATVCGRTTTTVVVASTNSNMMQRKR